MQMAETWPGACSASKEALRDVNKSPIIDGGEKSEKRSDTSAMCTKSAVVRQVVGSVPADHRRSVTEALPTSPKPRNSTD